MNWKNKRHSIVDFATKKYALIWAIFGVILAIIITLNTFERKNTSSIEQLKAMIANFNRLEVKNENGGYTIENNGGKFQLSSVDFDLLDKKKLREVVDFLRNSTISSIPKGEQAQPTKNRALATVRVQNKGKTLNFTVLSAAPAGLGHYIKFEDSVYLLLGASDLFSCTNLDFISKKLFSENFTNETPSEWIFSDSAANTINITGFGSESLKVSVNSNNKSLLSDKFRNVLINLVNLESSAVKSINPTPEEQDAFGVFLPHMQITIRRGTTTETIRLSKPTEGVCFILTANGKRVLTCQEADFPFWDLDFENLENLKKKYLVECSLNKIKTITISSKKKKWNLMFNPAATEPMASAANWEHILNLLGKFTIGQNTDFDLNGLQNLEFRLEITYESGGTDKYTFYSNSGDKYVVYGDDEKLCFPVNEKELTELTKAITELAKGASEKIERKTIANQPKV